MTIGALLERYFLHYGNECSIRFTTCPITEGNGFQLSQLDLTKHYYSNRNMEKVT